MFEKLLVPVDGSAYSKRAVKAAASLAECCGAAVYLLHVIRDLSLPKEILDMMAAGEITASRMQILQDSADIILENARAVVEAAGIAGIETECRMGDPASQILQYASEKEVDVIVLGHRGLGPNPDLLGGVARKIVNRTSISCLIIT